MTDRTEVKKTSHDADAQRPNERLVIRLRERLDIPDDITDERILKATDGSYSRAIIELDMKAEDLVICIKEEINTSRTKMTRSLTKFFTGV